MGGFAATCCWWAHLGLGSVAVGATKAAVQRGAALKRRKSPGFCLRLPCSAACPARPPASLCDACRCRCRWLKEPVVRQRPLMATNGPLHCAGPCCATATPLLQAQPHPPPSGHALTTRLAPPLGTLLPSAGLPARPPLLAARAPQAIDGQFVRQHPPTSPCSVGPWPVWGWRLRLADLHRSTRSPAAVPGRRGFTVLYSRPPPWGWLTALAQALCSRTQRHR